MSVKCAQVSAMWRILDGLLLADCRRCLRNLEWRLLIFRLRKRPQAWQKDNGWPSLFNRC